MSPATFPQANAIYGPPENLEESQCASIPAYQGFVTGGSLDGQMIAVVSWQPSEEERARIASGEPIFITMCGGLAPHYPSLDFHSATNPA